MFEMQPVFVLPVKLKNKIVVYIHLSESSFFVTILLKNSS